MIKNYATIVDVEPVHKKIRDLSFMIDYETDKLKSKGTYR